MKEAAKRGSDFAAYNLGLSYLRGTGVSTDQKQAFKWFLRSADNGIGEAQLLVAACYQGGVGVIEDLAKSFAYYEKAALNRVPDAQYQVAASYLEGDAVEKNYTKALAWFKTAADSGDQKAVQYVAHLSRELSQTEINRANNLYHEIKKKLTPRS